MQLIGEYVIEIVLPIEAALSGRLLADCARYLDENPRHAETLQRRAISYWSCYYRSRYPVLAEYPGTRAIRRIDASRASIARSPSR